MLEEVIYFMENKEKLMKLAKIKAQTSKMQNFNGLIGVYLGVEPKLHYPKMLDDNGNKIKETINGRERDKRSNVSDGYQYSFNEVGTGKIILVVVPNKLNVEMLSPYSISGYGYDISKSMMYFVEKNGTVSLVS